MAKIIDVGETIEKGPFGAFQKSVIAWLCLLMVVEGFDMQVMAYAAPAVLKEWNVSRAAFGPVLSASLFGYMVGAFVLAAAADRLGRKTVILIGLAIFGAFTLAGPLATSIEGLMALRFLAGVGLGAAVPTGVALSVEYTPLRSRGVAVGLMYTTYNIGAAGGGFLAGWLIPLFGWRSTFILGGVAPLLIGLLLIFGLTESVRFLALRGGRQSTVVAILRKLTGDASLDESTEVLVHEEVRHAASPTRLFKDGRAGMTVFLWLAIVSSFMGHHFLTNWLPTLMSDAGYPVGHAVVIGALFSLGGAVGSIVIGRAMDRRGFPIVALTFLVSCPFVALIGVAVAIEPLVAAVVFLAGFLVLGGQLGLNASSAMIYPTLLRSTGAGWALGIGRIGSIMGPIIGGVLITSGISRPALSLVAAVPMAVCALCIVLLRQARSKVPDAPALAADTAR